MDTESQSPPELWVDKMPILNGTQVMLNNQAEAIGAVQKALPQINTVIEQVLYKLNKNNTSRLIYAGAGTSARVAVQDAVELYPTFGWSKKRIGFLIAGGSKALIDSVEGAEDDTKEAKSKCNLLKIVEDDIVIGLAASGNTSFTNECLRYSHSLGALCIAISNNKKGKILKVAHHSIILNTGYEIIAGSTRLKAATAQKICLNIISSMIMTKLGFVKNGLMTHFITSNKKLKKRKEVFLQLTNKN